MIGVFLCRLGDYLPVSAMSFRLSSFLLLSACIAARMWADDAPEAVPAPEPVRPTAEPRWENLTAGMTEAEAVAVIGKPLIVHGGRGYVQWTFDVGGSVMFHSGTVLHWNTPRNYRPTATAGALTTSSVARLSAAALSVTQEKPASDTTPHSTGTGALPPPAITAPTETGAPLQLTPAPTQRTARVPSFAEIVKS